MAARQGELKEWLDDWEDDHDGEEVARAPSPQNPPQKRRVAIKRRTKSDEVYILRRSEGREEKDRAIRENHEQKLLKDWQRLQQHVAKGRLKQGDKIQRANRSASRALSSRRTLLARYYQIAFDSEKQKLSWQQQADKKAITEKLDGSYVLKTNRQPVTADEIWRLDILLARVEDAFRDMKSPLMERPIFHRLGNRTQTHIFLRAGLSATSHRISVLAGGDSHVVVDHPTATQHDIRS